MSRNVKTAIVVGLLLLAVLWWSGRMDPALSKVGLNKNDCVQNAFGATFCGDDAGNLTDCVHALTQQPLPCNDPTAIPR